MKNMIYGKLVTILFLSLSLLNVHSLSLKNKNPLGLKGKPLLGFVNNLHAGLDFFEDTKGAKWIFDQVADRGKYMSRDGMKIFLSKASASMGGGAGVPKWVVDRFWNEAEKKIKGEVDFEGFQNEMIFAISRDIVDFTKDIIKENPNWKYIRERN